MKALPRITGFLKKHPRPFIAKIAKDGSVSLVFQSLHAIRSIREDTPTILEATRKIMTYAGSLSKAAFLEDEKTFDDAG